MRFTHLARYIICVLFFALALLSVKAIDDYHRTIALLWSQDYGVRIYVDNHRKVKEYDKVFGEGYGFYVDVFMEVYRYRWQTFFQMPCDKVKIKTKVASYAADAFDWKITEVNQDDIVMENGENVMRLKNSCERLF